MLINATLPTVECTVPGLKIYAHYMVGHPEILKITPHNTGNKEVPSLLMQAVVTSVDVPDTRFFKCATRVTYNIPGDATVRRVSTQLGISHEEDGSPYDVLLLAIAWDSPTEGEGQHLHCLCRLP